MFFTQELITRVVVNDQTRFIDTCLIERWETAYLNLVGRTPNLPNDLTEEKIRENIWPLIEAAPNHLSLTKAERLAELCLLLAEKIQEPDRELVDFYHLTHQLVQAAHLRLG